MPHLLTYPKKMNAFWKKMAIPGYTIGFPATQQIHGLQNISILTQSHILSTQHQCLSFWLPSNSFNIQSTPVNCNITQHASRCHTPELIAIRAATLTNRTYQARRTLQTESTWRRWGNRKPAWSRGRARLSRLQAEIRKGGTLGYFTPHHFYGLGFYCHCVVALL